MEDINFNIGSSNNQAAYVTYYVFYYTNELGIKH